MHRTFGADPGELVGTVVVNGMIDAIDPATGRDVRECLITLRATRDQNLLALCQQQGIPARILRPAGR
ncbi:hypothetical protein [Pseudonocardia sp. H11422]|uniref:hypothetical protein n=1 Tax=Pseudonocardia sp. H11422 TaxID=2835866 RepID=UPI001BDBBDAF|nr:hypothetical protein [Pseudonocardia sp. H11422]